MTVVLDADLVIGALDAADAHHDSARASFERWEREQTTRLISLVTLAEVLVAPSASAARLRRAREALRALGVAAHRPTEAISVDAAVLRGRHPVSLPDAFCLATAARSGATVASFDGRLLRAAAAEQIPAAPLGRD